MIGILAVQGAFAEHETMLRSLGMQCRLLRQAADLKGSLDGVVLPGGESTVQEKLLRELGMFDFLSHSIAEGLPVLATCAGLILLAKHVSNDDRQTFATLPVTVRRNAYGRQLGSFIAEADVIGIGRFRMNFIRAPLIESVSPEVSVLARVENQIVAVRYGRQLALSFHPELGTDTRIHELFLQIVQGWS